MWTECVECGHRMFKVKEDQCEKCDSTNVFYEGFEAEDEVEEEFDIEDALH